MICGRSKNRHDTNSSLASIFVTMLKGDAPFRVRVFSSALAILLIQLVLLRTLAGGVTLITHGLEGDIKDWVRAMGMAIPNCPAYLGTNFTIYEMNVTNHAGLLATTAKKVSGSVAGDENRSGEIIIPLDWSTLADGWSFNTYQVAAAVVRHLMATNFISDLQRP